MKQSVAILGYSDNPERFSCKAFHMLKEYGHTPIPVGKGEKLTDIKTSVETLTMYVRPEISSRLKNDILKLKPKRVIFNPGTENPELEQELEKAGIRIVEACTLVLLKTNQFEAA